MRSLIRAALVAAALASPAAMSAAAQGAPKLAYINSQRILAEAPGRSEAEAAFQRELQGYQAQVKQMGDSLRALVQAYEKAASTLSPAAREERQKAIRTKEAEYQQRTNQLDQRAGARQDSLTRPILDRIQRAIEAERAAGGYAMIFDAGSQSGVLVAADKAFDITDKVLARLKTTASTSNGPGAASTGPAAAPAGATRPKTPPRD